MGQRNTVSRKTLVIAISVGVVLLAIVAVGGYDYLRHLMSAVPLLSKAPTSEAGKAATEMQKEIERVYESLSDEEGVPTTVEPAPDTQPVASGEFGEMERFLKVAMNRAVAQRNEYMGELEKIGWMRVLDPQRLAGDPDMTEGRQTLARAYEIVELYRQKNVELMGELSKSIDTLAVPEASRRQMRRGFESGLQRSGQDELWELERQVLEEVEGMLDVLAAGGWEVEEEQLLFSDDAGLERYQAHLERIGELVAEQNALQKRAQTRAIEQLQTLKRVQ